MCPKYTSTSALWALPMATTSGCINFNNYFPNAKSDLLYILTPSPLLPLGMLGLKMSNITCFHGQ